MLSLYSDDETHEVLIVKKQQITKFNRHPYLIIYNIYYHTIFNCTSNFNYNFDIYTYAHICIYTQIYNSEKVTACFSFVVSLFFARGQKTFSNRISGRAIRILYISPVVRSSLLPTPDHSQASF